MSTFSVGLIVRFNDESLTYLKLKCHRLNAFVNAMTGKAMIPFE